MAVIAPIVSTWDNSGVRKATKAFGGLTDSAKRSFGKIADAAKTTAIAIAGIGTAGVIGAKKAIDAASDLAETQSKVAQIFGDSNVAVEKFASTAADTLGQTRTEALNAAADFATFGKAAGLGGDELADFSTELVTLASDLGSFYNTDPAAAAEAIAAALRGESEPLRRYGVLLNDATLKAAAFELGIYDGEGALTAQQKVLAANQVILDQTTDAQGDFARTSDGLANAQRRLRARLGDTVTAIGTRLLPVALKITDFFLDKLVPAAEFVGTVFGAAGIGGVFRLFAFLIESQLGRAIDFALDLFRKLGDFLLNTALPFITEKAIAIGAALVDWIAPRIGPALEALLGWLESLGSWFVNTAVPYLYAKALELGAELVNWIAPRIGPALEALGGWLGDIANWFVNTALPKIIEKAIELGDEIVDWVAPRIPDILAALGDYLAKILTWFVETGLPAIIDEATKLGAAMVDWLYEILPELEEGLKNFLAAIFEWAKTSGVPSLYEIGKNLGGSIIDGWLDALRSESSRLGKVAEYVPGLGGLISGIRGAIELSGGVAGRTSTLEAFRTDLGIAPGAFTPTRAQQGLVGSGPNFGRGGGSTVNVTVNGAIDPVSTARQIDTILRQERSRSGGTLARS